MVADRYAVCIDLTEHVTGRPRRRALPLRHRHRRPLMYSYSLPASQRLVFVTLWCGWTRLTLLSFFQIKAPLPDLHWRPYTGFGVGRGFKPRRSGCSHAAIARLTLLIVMFCRPYISAEFHFSRCFSQPNTEGYAGMHADITRKARQLRI
jgi:hypothetical protein